MYLGAYAFHNFSFGVRVGWFDLRFSVPWAIRPGRPWVCACVVDHRSHVQRRGGPITPFHWEWPKLRRKKK